MKCMRKCAWRADRAEFGSQLTHARFNGVIIAWVRAECLHVFWFKMVWNFIITITATTTTTVGSWTSCCLRWCCWYFGTVVSLSLSLVMPIWMSMLQNQTNGLFYRWINSLRAHLWIILHIHARTHADIQSLSLCVCERDEIDSIGVWYASFVSLLISFSVCAVPLFHLLPFFYPHVLAAYFTYFPVDLSIRLEIAHLDTLVHLTFFLQFCCHFLL